MSNFLHVKNGVVLTENIKPVIEALDAAFGEAGLQAWVTSGLRAPQDQLRIIRNEVNRRNLNEHGDYQGVFEDIDKKFEYDGKEIYGWQLAWSKLLSLGFIVNPPYPAVVLMDYYRPGSATNRKGQLIGDSPHTRGTAFDISGGADGVANEAMVLEKAVGKIKNLKGYLIERNQNCVHVDCYPIK